VDHLHYGDIYYFYYFYSLHLRDSVSFCSSSEPAT
jgi:hypothetical protein